jgi:hypothetical protein
MNRVTEALHIDIICLLVAVENMLGPVKCGSKLAMDQSTVYFSTRLTLVCFIELLLTEFLLCLYTPTRPELGFVFFSQM